MADAAELLSKFGPVAAAALDDVEQNLTKVEQYNRLGEDEKAALAWAKVREGVAVLRNAYNSAMAEVTAPQT